MKVDTKWTFRISKLIGSVGQTAVNSLNSNLNHIFTQNMVSSVLTKLQTTKFTTTLPIGAFPISVSKVLKHAN